ncbi:MAG: nucleoside triphosphate pyrophosphohydrolase [Chromatiaceae bacterium]
MADREAYSLDDLLGILARLRDPASGCPWDRQQTFRSLLPYVLEEAYEVAEAIDREDMPALRDELGDLLFQIVFQARLGQESGLFDFPGIVDAICAKMIRRHPHVFAELDLGDAAAVSAHWERIKAGERAQQPAEAPPGLLAGVAQALPALIRAEKLQRRAARGGFDWDLATEVLDKVREEVAECAETLAEGASHQDRVHEVGDLLFATVNLARHLGVDAEQALRAANQRFENRFRYIEQALRDQGLTPAVEVRAEMERLWAAAKAVE